MFFLFFTLGFASRGRADNVAKLTSKLKNHSSYKVRLTAALVLRKACDPRAFKALARAVKSDKNAIVRSTAAASLASMGLLKAAGVLKKATRDSNSLVKKGAKRALGKLCPRSTRGKRRYVNLERITYSGPKKGRVAKTMVRCRLARAIRKKSGFLVSWRGCKRPKKRQLKRKRIKGYYVDVVIKVKMFGSKLGCKVSPTLFSYPRGKLLTTGGGTVVKIHGGMDNATIDTCIKHAIGNSVGGILSTLQRL